MEEERKRCWSTFSAIIYTTMGTHIYTSFLGVISYNPYIGGSKPSFLHGFGVQGQLVVEPTHLKHMLVKLDHETPRIRGENSKNI